MPDPSFRAVAILKAKRGLEQALLDFALDVGVEIRAVEGLRRLEISRSAADPGQLLLYYSWDSGAHSQRYLSSSLYARVAQQLKELLQAHELVLAELVSDR